MGGGTIHKVTRRGVQTLIARVHLNVHHIPAFELDITDFPFFSFFIAFKDKTTLLRSDQHHDLLQFQRWADLDAPPDEQPDKLHFHWALRVRDRPGVRDRLRIESTLYLQQWVGLGVP